MIGVANRPVTQCKFLDFDCCDSSPVFGKFGVVKLLVNFNSGNRGFCSNSSCLGPIKAMEASKTETYINGKVDRAPDSHSSGCNSTDDCNDLSGVDTIACVSVNDAFVTKYWKQNLGIKDEVLLLSDGNGEFTKAIGCELDLSDKPIGLGVRSRRYAMYVEDGVVKIVNLEEGGAFNVSRAEDLLKAI